MLLFLALGVNSQCNSGCLICTSTNVCSFCDFHGFILSGIKCVPFNNANCNIWDQSGNCLFCQTGYFNSIGTGTCLKVLTANLITNCVSFSSPSLCSVCITGYLVISNACVQSNSTITGCNVYDSTNAGKCLQCAAKYILNHDSVSCLPVPPITGCSGYTYANCLSCNTNYFLDLNLYKNSVFNPFQANVFTNAMYYDDLSFKDQGLFPSCRIVTAINCATYQNSRSCATCLPNFYLDSTNNCQPYPPQSVMNCVVYSSASSCIQCQPGFYPLTPTNCAPAVLTGNCILFNTTSNLLQCVSCQASYYLNSNNGCLLRSNSVNIALCSTTNPNADTCLTCQNGFTLTTDGLLCLPTISNCNIYIASTVNSKSLVCSACNNGLYYVSTSSTCVLGSVQNCQNIQTNTGICLVCLNGYYLSSGQCVKQPTIDSCNTYSQSVPGACISCVQNFYLFTNLNICNAIQPISNCTTYSSPTACSVCANRSYLTNTFTCAPIIIPQFCLQLSAQSQCVLCQTGYYLSNGICIAPYQYFGQFCAVNTASGTTALSSMNCQYCSQNYIPFNYINSYACYPQAFLTNLQTIANCAQYQVNTNSAVVCTGCANNFTIQTDGSCAQSCPTGVSLKVMEVFNGPTSATAYTNFLVTRTNVCATVSATPNCLVQYPDLFIHPAAAGEASYSCRGCANNFYRSIVSLQSVSVDNPATTLFPISPVAVFPGVSCNPATTLVRSGSTAGVIIDYCEYYYAIGSNWGCYKCSFGYSGVVTSFPSQSTKGYITSCISIPNCLTTFLHGHTKNLDMVQKYNTALGALYSCHACSNSMIPFLAIDFSTSTSIPAMSKFSPTSNPYNTGTGGMATNCYLPVAASFGITGANFNFPASCGLAVLNVVSSNSSATSNLATPVESTSAVFCYACAPGFSDTRATSDSAAPLLITSCTAIQFCTSSVWFNSCSQCNTNYAYPFNSITKTVSFSSCVLSPDPGNNCFAVDVNASRVVCRYCNLGYNLNYDKVCELIPSFMCNNPSIALFQQFDVISSSDNHNVGLFLMPFGPGCTSCQTGTISIKITTNQFICSISSYFTSNIYVSNTVFIVGCLNYYVNPTTFLLTCIVCSPNMVVSNNGLCYQISTYPNCLQINDNIPTTIVCSTCASGYVLILGACQLAAIKNCSIYSTATTNPSQVCLTCAPGYYLNANLCIIGNTINCIQQSSLNLCNICAAGFVLITLSNSNSYCYPIPRNNNCLSVGNGFSTGSITCTACALGFFVSTTIPPVNSTVCGTFNTIPNCATYDIQTNILQSSFLCTSCNNGFYVLSNVCVIRLNIIQKCTFYSNTTDECAVCGVETYLSPNKLTCQQNPTGMAGCLTYSSPSVCTTCGANSYLLNNTCTSILNSALVANCSTYSDATTCATCQFGFILTSPNVCSKSTATNCLTFQSTTACATCSPGFGLKQQTNGLSCAPITDQYCLSYNPIFPFNCNLCVSDYYPLDFVCTAVQVSINFCQVYESGTTCAKCNPGYILTQDKKSCTRSLTLLSKFDKQCSIMVMTLNPVCNKCMPGYFFQGTTCIPCQTSTGCYSCSGDDSTKCLLCAPGYYQSSNGTCSINLISGLNGTNQTNFTSKNDDRLFLKILLLAFSWFLLIME